MFSAETVVVGPDQKQHMELTIDISKKLNQNLGAQIFTAPKSVFGQKISSLKDPLQKMSKSAPDKDSSCIFLDDDSNSIRLKVQGATTDSVKTVYYDETDRPAVSSLIKLFSLTMGETDFAEAGRSIGDQGGCAQLKAILSDALNNLIQPINERYNNLIHNPRHLEDVLHDGSMKAREIAQRQFEVIKMHMMSPSVSG